MNGKSVPIKETLLLALGEAIVSAVVVAVFLLIQKYDFTVLTGVILGSCVIILNFLFLSLSVNRAIDNALLNAPRSTEKEAVSEFGENAAENESCKDCESEDKACAVADADILRDEGGGDCPSDGESAEDAECSEDTEDATDEVSLFAQQYAMSVQNTVKISYIIRTVTMLASLVAAFLLPGVFNVIATLIPLLMFRPILTVESLIRNKMR